MTVTIVISPTEFTLNSALLRSDTTSTIGTLCSQGSHPFNILSTQTSLTIGAPFWWLIDKAYLMVIWLLRTEHPGLWDEVLVGLVDDQESQEESDHRDDHDEEQDTSYTEGVYVIDHEKETPKERNHHDADSSHQSYRVTLSAIICIAHRGLLVCNLFLLLLIA